MKVLTKGHWYELECIDSSEHCLLIFVKREGPRYPGNVGAHYGTTSQEVLRALIDRAQYVNGQIPCWQTRLSVWLMRSIIWLYEHRAARVHGRRFSLSLLPRVE